MLEKLMRMGRIGTGVGVLLILALAIVAAIVVPGLADSPAAAAAAKGLHVSGNRLVDKDGRTVLFHGVNRSGTEYACVQGWGIFDGPGTANSVRAIARWHVNSVRIPVNEDCWLGINGINPRYAGTSYRQAIVNYVQRLHRYGMYAEVSLVWAAPGAERATYQPAAPDEGHAPAVWASMAATFKKDPNVILAPWGEPVVDADCFLKGGCDTAFGPRHIRYRVAGMQQAVTVMRRAGYKGIIAIPGIDYANNLSQWLSHMPRDPRHQLIAEAHVYGGNTCDAVACFQTTYAPVARRVPLVFGETGEDYTNRDCGTSHISTIVDWADAHHVGYDAWAWDTWGNCGILIRSYAGTPFSAYGALIRSHYARRRPRLIPSR
jgi:endoglucanase